MKETLRKEWVIAIYLLLMAWLAGCGASAGITGNGDQDTDLIFDGINISSFSVTSENLHGGVWDTAITNTSNGNNLSPQLSWEPIKDAGCYVIYMIDTSAGNWIHWMSNNVSGTELPEGWASADEYIGPYPPSGTHDYEIYIIALKNPVEGLKGKFDDSNPDIREDILSLDTLDGTEGNIVAYGHISGTYTK